MTTLMHTSDVQSRHQNGLGHTAWQVEDEFLRVPTVEYHSVTR